MTNRRPTLSRTLPFLAFSAAFLWTACSETGTDPLAGPEPSPVAVPQQASGYEAALAAQDRHTAALMSRAGVLGTGVGTDAEGRHVVTVYTLRPGAPTLPTQLEGVEVIRVATGMIVAGDVDDPNDPTTKERPAPNGFSIGHPDITAGTLGAIVKNSAGDRFILSNNHVLAASNGASIGDPSLQPGPFDGGTSADQIGTLFDFVPIDFNGGNNTVDAAIASVAGADVTAATPSYGAPRTTTVSASVGQDVQKYGRTTRHTTGEVAETNVTVDVCYAARGPFNCIRLARFVDQIAISDGNFSDGGDSGSLIVDSNRNPVGLLFAGSSTRTIANPIDAALGAFNVTVTDDPGDGGGEDPLANNPPTASFTFSCTNLNCDFDGRGSSDGDGSIASYSWDFGDGSENGSGPTPSHDYASGGTYTVTLTVTDDDGDSDSDSQDVTVGEEPSGGDFTLSTVGYKVRGLHKADLTWAGTTATNVDILRDGIVIETVANTGAYTDNIDQRGGGSYVYQVCEAGSSTCSNTATVVF